MRRFLVAAAVVGIVAAAASVGFTRRPPLASPKDPNNLTDAEKLAQREAWAPFTAKAGTYEIKGNSVIHHQVVAKAPAPAAGYGAETLAGFENVKIEGNTNVRTAKTADGKGVTTSTFTRLEWAVGSGGAVSRSLSSGTSPQTFRRSPVGARS